MLQIIDNFLPSRYFNELTSRICHNNFPWYYFENNTYNPRLNRHVKSKYFSHMVVSNNQHNSDLANFFSPSMFYIEEKLKIQIVNVALIRLMMFVSSVENDAQEYIIGSNTNTSTDFLKYYMALFNLNDCDGETIISPKSNEKMIGEYNYNSNGDIVEQNRANRMILCDKNYLIRDRFPKTSLNKTTLCMIFEANENENSSRTV